MAGGDFIRSAVKARKARTVARFGGEGQGRSEPPAPPTLNKRTGNQGGQGNLDAMLEPEPPSFSDAVRQALSGPRYRGDGPWRGVDLG